MKSLPFIDVSNPIWYLLRSDSKRSFITSSVFPWIKISELSLFECITRSSSVSLEEVKLIANCYLNFPRIFWDYLWCLSSMVSFHPGVLWFMGFCFYHHYFYIWYNCCYKSYLLLLVCNNLLVQTASSYL